MRKLIFLLFVVGAFCSLMTCELFSPDLGDNVDLEAPALFVTSHPNGSYVRGTITLTGNFLEDVAVASIGVSFDDGANFTLASLDQAARKWSLEVDTTLLPDGEVDVLFRITDGSGKQTDKKILLYLDNTPPLVMVTSPSVYGASTPAYYSTFSLKGETYDPFGMLSVVVQIYDNAPTPALIIEGTANGTSTWSYTFQSQTYIPATGTLNFAVIGTDKAGNVSSTYYHYTDVYNANSLTPIIIDDIYKVLHDQLTNVDVKTYLDTHGTTYIPYYFDQDLSKPTIDIYNPDSSGAATNMLTSNARLNGRVFDDEGVDLYTFAYRITRDAGATVVVDWTYPYPAPQPSQYLEVLSWSFYLPGSGVLSDGDYEVTVRASDKAGNQRVEAPRAFRIDSGVPVIVVNQPTQGQYLGANFTITGTASDAQGIKKVEVSLDDGQTFADATGTDSWSYPVTNAVEGSMFIKVRATENTLEEKKSTYNLQVIVDKTPPTVSFLYPPLSSTVNGMVLIRGTSSDNTQIEEDKVELRIGKPSTWLVMTNLYNWEYQLDSTSYANSTYADDMGGGVWKLYIHARVIDKAGNVTTKNDYYFLIDLDTDKPKVTILSPSNGQNLAGPVLISGTAVDDDAVDYVQMQIDVNGDGDFADQIDFRGASSKAKDSDTDDRFEDETQWYTVDGKTAWTEMLNNYGELYARTDTIPPLSGDIIIRVRAVDINIPPVTGNYQEIAIHLDDLIPRVENLNYTSGDYVKGSITITGDAWDDPTTQLSYIGISYNGGITYENVIAEALKTTCVSPTHYQLHITINTLTYIPTSGIFYLRLKVIDSANLQSIMMLNLNVDNQPPTASWSNSTTHPDGSNLYNGMITVNAVNKTYMEGNYSDPGAVGGISHVELYVVKDGSVRNLKSTGTWGGTPVTESIEVENYDLGTNTWSTAIDPAALYVTHASLGNNYVIKVDKAFEMSDINLGTDIDGDGYHEFLGVYEGSARWRAYLDSQYLPDGIADLHYVVYDLAGNRIHKMRQVFIANYRPVVDRIRVGSDLNISGTVADVGGGVTEIQDYYYPSGFINRTDYQKIKNNKLYFNIEGSDPNGTVKQIFIDVYDSTGATYIGQAYASGLNPPGGDITTTLNVNPGTAPWTDDGNYNVAPYKVDYLVKATVRDNDDISISRWVKVSVLNPIDEPLPPIVTLPSTLFQSDQDENIGHLELIGDNTPGDWNIIKAAYDNDDDPKGSGIIVMKGTVTDENRITEINVTSENNPLPILASWSGGLLVSNNGSVFTIDTQQLTENGHTVTFTYKWNSAYVTGVAGMNKTVTFSAKDGALHNATPRTRQLDVVPYIKTITRQSPLPMNRTKYGKFLLTYGETDVVVTGFNLGSASYLPTVNIGTNTIAVSGSGSPYTSLTFTGTQMTNSGSLRVTVSSRQSINNLNANTLTSNKEDDGSGLGATLWNDDRYIVVFDIGDYFTGSDVPEWPSMSFNPANGRIYGAWTSYNTAVAYYAGPNSQATGWAARISLWSQYDPPEYTDIFVRNNAGADVKHTIVLENENALGTWRGLYSEVDNGSERLIEREGNASTIDHSDGQDEMLFQFKNPRHTVVTGATPTNDVKYISYYDDWSNCLKYGVVTGGTGTFIGQNHLTDNQVVVDGYDYLAGSAPNYKYASSEDVGLWNDIGVDPDDGVPVIVYYSTTYRTLKIARGWDTQPVGNFNASAPYAPSATHEWNIANVQPTNSYLGSYVSMIVDCNATSTTYGDLYIVTYQNATGDLVFIHGHDVDGTGSGKYYTFDTPVTIDTVGSVGAWSDIALMYNGTTAIPYVSYLNSSAVGTLEGLKYAWVQSGTGASAADWEYGIIPVNDPVRDHRSNIEVSSSVNIGRWVSGTARSADVAIGFAGTYFNLAYRMKE